MRQNQTFENIMYLAGLEALKNIALKQEWNQRQFKQAQQELIRKYQPTLIVI